MNEPVSKERLKELLELFTIQFFTVAVDTNSEAWLAERGFKVDKHKFNQEPTYRSKLIAKYTKEKDKFQKVLEAIFPKESLDKIKELKAQIEAAK